MTLRLRSGAGRTPALLLLSGLAVSCRQPGTSTPSRQLEIAYPGAAATKLSSEQLRQHPSTVSLVMSDAPAYPGVTLKLAAVPMKALLPSQYSRADMSIVFECLDGFAAAIPAARVLGESPDGARAFLAIEDPAAPWPLLKERPGTTAGPFYLIWKAADNGRPVSEDWPYQVTRIVVKDLQGQFRGISPDSSVDSHSPITAGFQVFIANCSVCHTLNGVGDGHMGPDLNQPMNPTEYFRSGVFERYVRNPHAVLEWKGQRMPSFPVEVMTDAELAQLRSYLEYMAGRKHAAPPGSSANADRPPGIR